MKYKLYYQAHKEEMSMRVKVYQQKHKKDISKKRGQKRTCSCGGRSTHAYKSQHLRTKKHQKYQMMVDELENILQIHEDMKKSCQKLLK